MKGKKVIATMAVVLGITIPSTVFAATSNTVPAKALRGFFGLDTSKLTDTQKTNITDYSKKMAELQKQFISSMVTNGTITKAQGDAQIKSIDDALANGSYSPALFGNGGGRHGGRGGWGIDSSKLTDAQKKELAAINTKMVELEKALVQKEVADGLITKAQGDSMTTRITDEQKNNTDYGFMGRGSRMGMFGIDSSKLTTAQKNDLTDYGKKFAALQKELINKYVAFGLLTKTQGDQMLQGIDSTGNSMINGIQKGGMNGHGMHGNGGMRGRGMMGNGGRI